MSNDRRDAIIKRFIERLDLLPRFLDLHLLFHCFSIMSAIYIEYRYVSGTIEADLLGDLLVRPIDGFGTGYPHLNSPESNDLPCP